jgi:hypothetical protein
VLVPELSRISFPPQVLSDGTVAIFAKHAHRARVEHAIPNNTHHIPGSKTRLIWQNTLHRLALARLNMPPSREKLNVISAMGRGFLK